MSLPSKLAFSGLMPAAAAAAEELLAPLGLSTPALKPLHFLVMTMPMRTPVTRATTAVQRVEAAKVCPE